MHRGVLLSVIAAVALIVGCRPAQKWTVRPVASIGHMETPECAVVEPSTGAVYVSNMQTDGEQYWADDDKAFISLLMPGGTPAALSWKESSKEMPINQPKGMTIFQGVLYVADNTRIVGYPLFDGVEPKPLKGPRGKCLNDMATDGKAIYVSDTEAGCVYRMSDEGIRVIKAPPGVNGITFWQDKMFAVSWTLHDVYELDPSGRAEPVPFGLAANFLALDSIEVLRDGTFVVSDFDGGRIATIAPDRKTIHTLLEVPTPADIGLDRERDYLYVPSVKGGRVVIMLLEEARKQR